MTKYIVNTLCILNQENPTPSKSMDIAINIIPVKKNKKFENFVLGIDNYQQCCEGFGAECTLGERFEEEKFIESIEVYVDVPDTLYPTYVDCGELLELSNVRFIQGNHERHVRNYVYGTENYTKQFRDTTLVKILEKTDDTEILKNLVDRLEEFPF